MMLLPINSWSVYNYCYLFQISVTFIFKTIPSLLFLDLLIDPAASGLFLRKIQYIDCQYVNDWILEFLTTLIAKARDLIFLVTVPTLQYVK